MCKLIIAQNGRIYAPAMLHIAPNPPHWKRPITGNISFLVDTGADVTCLSALDAERLEIYTDILQEAGDITGLKGKIRSFKLPKVDVAFIDDISDIFVQYHIEETDYIRVAELPKEKDNAQEESNVSDIEGSKELFGLLGLDILQYFDLSTERENGLAYLKRIRTQLGKYRTSRRRMPGSTP